MNILTEYINYRFKAKGRHGVHSPFVYSFLNECLSTKIDKKNKNLRQNLFKILKNNNLEIEITDFGVGSKKLNNKRKISKIFSTSSSKGKYGDLLFKIANFYQPKHTLELGTSLGIGSIQISLGNSSSLMTSIEACKNTYQEALKNVAFLNLTNIQIINSTFSEYISKLSNESFDLIFIDGHHDGKALINYIADLQAFSHNDTIFILDDIRWSQSMFEAWNEIINNNEFHLTIDLFRMGIIIKRHQQEKEHFILKI
jgi:predicted O-methyltransferase YrrM